MKSESDSRPEISVREVAVAARDPFFPPWGGRLHPRDDTLATRGGPRGIWIYNDLRRDGVAHAALGKRTISLLSRPWSVEARGSRAIDLAAADTLREFLKVFRFARLCGGLLDAVNKGYSVCELIWGRWGATQLMMPLRVFKRDQRRFVFGEDRELRMLVPEAMVNGVPVPPRAFIVHTHGDNDDSPYGEGLGSKLWWYVFFKRQGIAFWLQFVDRLAVPTTVGKYPRGGGEEAQRKLAEALEHVRSASALTISDDMLVEFLELKASGSINSQEALVRYMDEQIRETVGLEVGGAAGGGALAAAAIDRREIRRDILSADAEALSETLEDTLVRWICEVNFPGAEIPQLYFDTDEPEDLEARSRRDKALAEMGFRPTLEHVRQVYGGEYEDVGAQAAARTGSAAREVPRAESPAGTSAQAAHFAAQPSGFPDQDAVDAALDAALSGEQTRLMAPVLAPVLRAVTEARDGLDALGRLAEAYPQMNASRLEELIARMLFVAEIHGRLSAQEETSGA